MGKKNPTFCGFPWVETSTAGRVYDLCVYYMTGAPEGSLKVVLWFYGEAGNRTCDPWFTRHSAYPLHHGGFSVIWLIGVRPNLIIWVVGVSPNLFTWVVDIYSFAKLKKNGLHLSLNYKTVTTNSI